MTGVKAAERDPKKVCDVSECNAWKEGDYPYCHNHKGLAQTDGGKPNNGNAVKHNLDADRSKLWERMPEERQTLWKEIYQSQIDRHKEVHGREPTTKELESFHELAWSAIHRRYVRDYMAECIEDTGNPLREFQRREIDGEMVEVERPNGLLSEISNTRREDRLFEKDGGYLNSPEKAHAEGLRDLHQVLSED